MGKRTTYNPVEELTLPPVKASVGKMREFVSIVPSVWCIIVRSIAYMK